MYSMLMHPGLAAKWQEEMIASLELHALDKKLKFMQHYGYTSKKHLFHDIKVL